MTALPLLRVRLRLKASLGTPLTSGTLFGHLCWAIRQRDGDAGLTRWLDGQAEAPWILSDGLPAGLLPRPLLRPSVRPRSEAVDIRAADEAKKQTRRAWISTDVFLATREAMSEQALAPHLMDRTDRETLRHVRLAHNRIDRRTGATPEEGGLYFADEDWSFAEAPLRDVYVRTAADPVSVEALLRDVGEMGYGRDSSVGRGRFAVEGVQPVPELDSHYGRRRLSLSHGTIGANMAAPRYRLFTHYGKVGEVMAMTGARVWKLPILLARPGATFEALDDGPFGALLANVHQDNAAIRHDARHVAIPYSEVEANA